MTARRTRAEHEAYLAEVQQRLADSAPPIRPEVRDRLAALIAADLRRPDRKE